MLSSALVLLLVVSTLPADLLAQSQVAKTRINKPAEKARIKSYASKAKQPVLNIETKNVGSKWNTQIKVDLGSAFTMPSDQFVEGAKGTQFTSVSWARLTEQDLPQGASIVFPGKAGEPQLPYLSFSVAVPAEARELTSKQTIQKSSTLGSIKLLPLARRLNDTTSVREYSPTIYTSAKPEPFSANGPARMRQLTMVQVMVPLVEFRANGESKAIESVTIELTYSAPGSRRATYSDKHFGSVYKNLVVNASDIARFAGNYTSSAGKGSSKQAFDESVINWIDQSSPYIKLSVTRDGLYRVTAAELNASSINVAQWDADQVRLINRGVEVPVFVEMDGSGKLAAIEFYGERLRGFGSEWFNYETDNNPYWLTTSAKLGGEPKRYTIRDIASASKTIREGVVTLHHERDFNHYGGAKFGFSDQERTFRTQWVKDERWYWKMLTPNTSLRDTFFVAALPSDASAKTAAVSFALHGVSYDAEVPDPHHLQVLLNGTKIHEEIFQAYDSLARSIPVAASSLVQGPNIIEFVSLSTPAAQNSFYVDRYRVSYPQPLVGSIDTAVVRGQIDAVIAEQGPYTLELPQAYTAYNLSDGVRLVRPVDQPQRANARYVAADAISFLKPSKMVGWNKDGRGFSILDKSNGADYIVLTHPMFLDNANKLKLRREAAGLRSKVVTTDEVFNTFSFGSEEAWSIRRFIDYAYHNYSGTPPAFVTLFGDATWDPKFNRTNREYTPEGEITRHRSLVPTYGIPASDYIFATVDGEGIDSVFPEVILTRIPTETKEDADNFVSKLIEYESRPPEAWNREFLFVIGGDGPPDSFEHYRFAEEVTIYTEIPPGHANYQGGLRFPPLNIRDTRIHREVFGPTDVTQVPKLQTEFREGKSLVHFAGHGATFITDVFFGDPGLYRNQGLYPVFITLSCRTGAFAEPYSITLNEAFLRTHGGGVINALGTTGFGEPTYDYTLSAYLFKMFREDTLFQDTTYDSKSLNISAMMTVAKVLASLASWGDVAENSRLQYSILGDAAMGFAFRPQPEFHIEASDISLIAKSGEDRSVFEADEQTFQVKIALHNFGFSAEQPVQIRVRDESSLLLEVRDTIPFLHVSDTITLDLPLDTNRLGQHTLRITIDPDQEFSEANENDNEVGVSFIVNGQSARPIFPFEASRAMCGINGDSVLIRIEVPERKFVQSRDRLEIEFDTTARFTSPVTRSALSAGFPTVSNSYFASQLPRNYQNVVYWRTRAVINGVASIWTASSFKIDKLDDPQMHLSSSDQLESMIEVGLQVNAADRLTIPQTDTVSYTVVAHGSADTTINTFSVSQIFRNDKPIYDLSHPKSGFAIVVMTEDANNVEQVHEFIGIPHDDLPLHEMRAKQVDSIIRAIPEGRLTMVLTNFQPFVAPFFSRDTVYIRPALRMLGAEIGFDKLDYFRSYAMIGRKGWQPGQAIEDWDTARSDGSEVTYNVVTLGTSGLARTPFTATAQSYKRVRWTGPAVPSGSSIKFTLLGQRKDDNRIERLTSFPGASTYDQDISSIDAKVYSRLAVEAEFARTSNSSTSPELASIAIEYMPAPELELTSLTADVSSVEEGGSVVATYVVRNLLCFPAENVDLQLLRTFRSRVDTIIIRTISIPGNGELSFSDSVSTSGLEERLTITATVNPLAKLNEQFSNNNSRSLDVIVTRDTNRPHVEALFDDRRISDRDFVAPDVEIRMQLFDGSPLRVSDSLSVTGMLRYSKDLTNPIMLTYSNPAVDFRIDYKAYGSGELQAELVVHPKTPLKPGEYTLTVYARDASGNTADTLEVRFQVSASNGIQQVMNYPNPFTSYTDFTFILRGSGVGAAAKVTVYTISGKKIKTLTPTSLRTGLNTVHWDGRDENGNEVANGTYLYRVSINANNADGSDVEEGVTERAVKSK